MGDDLLPSDPASLPFSTAEQARPPSHSHGAGTVAGKGRETKRAFCWEHEASPAKIHRDTLPHSCSCRAGAAQGILPASMSTDVGGEGHQKPCRGTGLAAGASLQHVAAAFHTQSSSQTPALLPSPGPIASPAGSAFCSSPATRKGLNAGRTQSHLSSPCHFPIGTWLYFLMKLLIVG